MRQFFWGTKKRQYITVFTFFSCSSLLFIASYFSIPSHLIFVYYCYAVSFLKGTQFAINYTPYCTNFITYRGVAFQAFPPEYPLLPLLLFMIPLLAPFPYEGMFIFIMVDAYLFLTIFFLRQRSPRHALTFILLTTIGGLGTVVGRYDLLVGMCILLAYTSYQSGKTYRIYAFLALGTLLKVVPLLLLPLFLFSQTKKLSHLFQRKNILSFLLFIAICSFMTSISFLINRQGTVYPLTYFAQRPFEIGSTPSLFLFFIFSNMYPSHLCTTFSFGSLNLIPYLTSCTYPNSSIMQIFSLIFLVGEILLLLSILILFLRKRLALSSTILCILISLLLTGKVFSPQYLLWIIPLVVYCFGKDKVVLLLWTGIGFFTTLLYPFFEEKFVFIPTVSSTLFFTVSLIRTIFLASSFVYFIWYDLKQSRNLI